jgi:tellurite methyltransferase
MSALPEGLSGLDIYLLDQVLRGRVGEAARILDVGCGKGRNLRWFLGRRHECHAVDRAERSVEATRALFAEHGAPAERVRQEALELMTVSDGAFDLVICNAVLHFADDEQHLRAMLERCWRALAPGGVFFARLASTIGLPAERFTALGQGRFIQPDGDTRFLVDQALLLSLTAELGATLLDPLKTTVVQDARCMTTWVLGKPAAPAPSEKTP